MNRRRPRPLLTLKLWDNRESRVPTPARPWRLGLEAERYGGAFNLHSNGIDGDFDELVVAEWLHIERMGERVWWMRVGGREFDVEIPLEGPVIVYERAEQLFWGE